MKIEIVSMGILPSLEKFIRRIICNRVLGKHWIWLKSQIPKVLIAIISVAKIALFSFEKTTYIALLFKPFTSSWKYNYTAWAFLLALKKLEE